MIRNSRPEAVAPWDALALYVDRDAAEELYRLADQGFLNSPVVVWPEAHVGGGAGDHTDQVLRARQLFRKLRSLLLRMLQSGELVADGFLSGAPLDAPRQRIPAERWAELTFDVRAAVAEGVGIRVSKIQIVSRARGRAAIDKETGKRPISELREWFIEERLRAFKDEIRHPSEEADWIAANEVFGDISRQKIRDLRHELVPKRRMKPGRPKKQQ